MQSDPDIQIGDTARDIVSGLQGLVVARTAYLSGCDRISIQPKGTKDGKPYDWLSIDILQAEKIDKPRVVLVPQQPVRTQQQTAKDSPMKTGGPRPEPFRH